MPRGAAQGSDSTSSMPAQLSLFDAPADVPTGQLPGPAFAPAARGAAAPVTAPAEPPSTSYRHPRSDRELRLGTHLVAYALRRSRRRSVGFLIDGDGLTVSAPRWVAQPDIDTALREKAGWILRQLHSQRERARRLAATRVVWEQGARFPFLGQPVELALGATTSGAVLRAAEAGVLDASATAPARLVLELGLPPSAEPTQVRDAVHSWLQRQARRIFDERVAVFATRLGVTVRRVALSSAQTRWGSASADGSIRLNWRLVHFALPTIDYVVAHELAHLRHMDHSPRFWDVVRSVVPDLESAKSTLRQHELPPMD